MTPHEPSSEELGKGAPESRKRFDEWLDQTRRERQKERERSNAANGGWIVLLSVVAVLVGHWASNDGPNLEHPVDLQLELIPEPENEIRPESERLFSAADAEAMTDARREAAAIAKEYRRLLMQGASKSEIDELESRIEGVEQTFRLWLEDVNRSPEQPGYTLEVRRDAAIQVLVEQGFPRSEAELNVQAMIEHGMLPDPPDPQSASSAPVLKNRYYRDRHGSIVSEALAEAQLRSLRDKVGAMPDEYERAYYEGVLSAVEEEWTRIKSQGPIER